MRFVIVGCGIAGYTAAAGIREKIPDSQVTVVTDADCGLYTKMRLPDALAGKLPEQKLFIADCEAVRAKGIKLFTGCRVRGIEPDAKCIMLDSGRVLEYDELVLATGASASYPPIPGADASMTLRTIDDMRRLSAEAEGVDEAVVIGGGVLGLEAAGALKARNIRVTVVEMAERLLPHQLTEKESSVLKKMLEDSGFVILTGAQTEKIVHTGSSFEVALKDSGTLAAGMVMISAGIKPETGLAKKAGLKIGRGIIVDERFATSEKHIYAIGDCAEVNGRVYGLWMASKDQAEALASIFAGQLDKYVPRDFAPVPKIPGISMKALKAAAAEI